MDNEVFSVKIITINDGLQEYNDIKVIRIKSKDYNLLIMKDYMPILGELEGNISFEGVTTNKSFEGIKAFYMSKNNMFCLIMQ